MSQKQYWDTFHLKPALYALLIVIAACLGAYLPSAYADVLFPNICSVVKSAQFRSCLEFSVSGCMCGFPPRPCAQISYSVPETFIEVWPNATDSFFSTLPGASVQLQSHLLDSKIPFGEIDDEGSFSFHARSVAVPFASMALSPLPCGGTRSEKSCFDLMSEDLGQAWKDGKADSLQPQYLAWSLAPKACLLKGAASGLTGDINASFGSDSGGCSYSLAKIPKYPPSSREACNGWGTFFPRSGVYQGGASSAAALMVASRLKSLGTELSHTIPTDPGETWQMLYPQSSACFREGQNLGWLEIGTGVREEQRMMGKLRGYLFVIWKKVSCCQDIPTVATSQAALAGLQAACMGMSGGGV